MLNRWALTSEMRGKYIPIILDFIDQVEAVDSDTQDELLEIDLSGTELNPSRLIDLMKEIGYTDEEPDTNGWQWDYWCKMTKDGFKDILVEAQGMTFSLKLSETD